MPSDSVVHVIDDDDAVRESLAFLLRSAKIDVRSYQTAEDFLDQLPSVKMGCKGGSGGVVSGTPVATVASNSRLKLMSRPPPLLL